MQDGLAMENFTLDGNFSMDDDGTHCMIPQAQDDLTYRIVYRIMLPIVCAGGIVGIILTVIVLTRKTMRSSTNCYLTGLSIADLLFLVILSTRLLDTTFSHASNEYHLFAIYMTYANIFLNAFLIASIWMTVNWRSSATSRFASRSSRPAPARSCAPAS